MKRPVLLGLFAAALVAAPAQAHHGWTGYHDEEFALTGTVVSAELVQPHGLIRLRTKEGVWDVVLSPLFAISRAGLEKAALPAGATVTARGHRHRDAKRLEMKTERLVVGGRTYDLYPARP